MQLSRPVPPPKKKVRKSLRNINTWKESVRISIWFKSTLVHTTKGINWLALFEEFYQSKELFFLIMFFATCRHVFSLRAWIQSKQIMKQILRSTSCKWPIQKIHTMKSMGFVLNSIISFLEKLKIPFIRSDLFSIVHLWRESLLQRKLGATIQFTGWTLTLNSSQ